MQEWLTESQALADAAGSADDQTHATVGFGQLAWLRGDHDRAAQLMEECLPPAPSASALRGQALHVLGERAREQQQLARAEELLRASVAAIAMAGQSIVLVSALELWLLYPAPRTARGTRPCCSVSRIPRASPASAHMRPAQPPERELRRSLAQVLGTAAFDAAYSEGKLLSPVQALQRAPSGRGDSSGSANT